jgi:transcriptional regulator with XRE-family HTH domain
MCISASAAPASPTWSEHLAPVVGMSGEALTPRVPAPSDGRSTGSPRTEGWSVCSPVDLRPSRHDLGPPEAQTCRDGKVSSRSLAEARKRLGLTARVVAEALHVSRATVSRWEAGTHRPAGPYLQPLCAVLSISASELDALLMRHPPSRADASALPGLRDLRGRQGLRAGACARALDVAPSTWSNWERGKTPVPRHLIPELARLLATDEPTLQRWAAQSVPATAPTVWGPLRRAAGMTQREAAAVLHVSVSRLSRIENGHRPTSPRLADRMHRVYASATPDTTAASRPRRDRVRQLADLTVAEDWAFVTWPHHRPPRPTDHRRRQAVVGEGQ